MITLNDMKEWETATNAVMAVMQQPHNNRPVAGARAQEIGGEYLIEQMNEVHWMTSNPPHHYVRLVLDRWAMEYPNQVRMLCRKSETTEWLVDSAVVQGNLERDWMTSLDAQKMREQGMADTDILKEANFQLEIAPELPYRHLDKE